MTFFRKAQSEVGIKPEKPDFDALFQSHWERVCRVLNNLVGDWDEAQDLALEVFVRLHNRPPQDPSNIAGWLYRVATRMGFNALRERKRRRHYEQKAGELAFGDDGGDPALVAEHRMEREQVRQTLSVMNRRSAELLILRHSGLSYAEVAAALNVSPASVGALLARAEAEFERKHHHLETRQSGKPGFTPEERSC